jgi:hypothetical protein
MTGTGYRCNRIFIILSRKDFIKESFIHNEFFIPCNPDEWLTCAGWFFWSFHIFLNGMVSQISSANRHQSSALGFPLVRTR